MRLHRFIISANLTQSRTHITDGNLLHQWAKVLRLAPGDAMILCDGKGSEGKGTIVKMDNDSATIDLGALHPVAAEPARLVTLYCSVLKRENFELVVQKSIEAGIKTIVPVLSARTVKTGLKMDRLRTIAREAAEQAGRGIIPSIVEPLEFNRALSEAKNQENLFFDCRKNDNHQPACPPDRQATRTSANPKRLSIWIGPEGGWTEEEAEVALQNGCRIVSLGALTLRAETAAIIATYLAVHGLSS